MLIGELAKQSGLSKATIRNYETKGLINARQRAAGSRFYQDFDADSLQRLEYLLIAKSLGFTLKEAKPYLDLLMAKRLSRAKKRALLTEKTQELETRIKALQQIRRRLIELTRRFAD